MLGKDSMGRHVPTSGTSPSIEEVVNARRWLAPCLAKVRPHGEDLALLRWWDMRAWTGTAPMSVEFGFPTPGHTHVPAF